MKIFAMPWRSTLKTTITSIAGRMILWPTSYNYHALLGYVLKGLQQLQANKCIGNFAINSSSHFSSGEVYKYKKVVQASGKDLQVDLGLARERLHDIFIKDQITQYLGLSGKESLLEIGCEAGQNLTALQEALPSMQLSGCDISRTALAHAEKAGFSVWQINLLEADSLGVFHDGQFDYILVSHVLEHLVVKDIQHTNNIQCNVLKHIHRIARCGYVVTAQAISQDPAPTILSFLGHSRVALSALRTANLEDAGVSEFLVTSNRADGSLSLVVRK